MVPLPLSSALPLPSPLYKFFGARTIFSCICTAIPTTEFGSGQCLSLLPQPYYYLICRDLMIPFGWHILNAHDYCLDIISF